MGKARATATRRTVITNILPFRSDCNSIVIMYSYCKLLEQCPSTLSHKNRISINPDLVKTKPIKTTVKGFIISN